MSSDEFEIPENAAELYRDAPYISALLRMAHQFTRRRSMEALAERGFGEINDALMSAFNFPPPNGVRLGELADRMMATKQAANYLVGKLEELGYLKRRQAKSGGQRLIYLTERGWQVSRTIWDTQRQVETELAGLVGKKQFDGFKSVLKRLVAEDAHGAGE